MGVPLEQPPMTPSPRPPRQTPSLRTLIVCLLAAVPAHAQPLTGYWCGVGEQSNPDGTRSDWTARMHLTGPGGTMDYPSLDCGGTLTFERRDGDVHLYRERITYGRDRCIDGGLVAVEPLNTSLRWQWTGSGVTASSLLAPDCQERPSS